MKKSNVKAHKKTILGKLREAGPKGLNKSQLGIRSSKTLKNKALEELNKDRIIANLGSTKKTQYVLKKFDTPLEIACEIIEKKATDQMALFSQTALVKDCPSGKVRNHAKKAVDWLVKEKKLLNLKYGKNMLYMHISAVQAFTSPAKETEPVASPVESSSPPAEAEPVRSPEVESSSAPAEAEPVSSPQVESSSAPAEAEPVSSPQAESSASPAEAKQQSTSAETEPVSSPEPAPESPQVEAEPEEKKTPPPKLIMDKVLEAYSKVKERAGFSNVEIYELQQELGAPMDQLKAFILKTCRQDKAVLSFGDWSLSSEETRTGAIYLVGNPHLMVRFRG